MKINPIASNLVEIEVSNMVIEVSVQNDNKVYVYPKTNCDVEISESYGTKKAEFKYTAVKNK